MHSYSIRSLVSSHFDTKRKKRMEQKNAKGEIHHFLLSSAAAGCDAGIVGNS